MPLPSKPTLARLEAEEGEFMIKQRKKALLGFKFLTRWFQLWCFFPPIILVSTRQLAGSIPCCLSDWKRITNNNSLLNIISSGYRIQFPIALYESKYIVLVPSKLNSEIIGGQILNHLESGAISIFPSVEGQHISVEYLLLKSHMVKS